MGSAQPAQARDWNGVLMAAAAVLALSVLTAPLLPLFDPDEGYYPATASESLRSGSSWDPRLNGEPRWDKPYLPYAVVEASFVLFGERVTAARLPSALQGSALVLVVGIAVSRLAGNRQDNPQRGFWQRRSASRSFRELPIQRLLSWLEAAQTREPWRSLRTSVVDRTGTMTLLRVAPKHKPMARIGPTPLGSF